MFLRIKNVLTAAEVARLVQLSRELRFVDGRMSNPANQTKDNLQADPADARSAESAQIVQAALVRSREFVDFTMPKRIAAPLLCRYEPGMKYGAHADSAMLPLVGGRLRSDISCTVFVSPQRSPSHSPQYVYLALAHLPRSSPLLPTNSAYLYRFVLPALRACPPLYQPRQTLPTAPHRPLLLRKTCPCLAQGDEDDYAWTVHPLDWRSRQETDAIQALARCRQRRPCCW